jgi:hypothetical protein
MLPFHLGGERNQLLDRQQAQAASHQGVDTVVKLISTVLRLANVRRGCALGDQMEYRLINGARQNLTDDLKIKGKVAIKLRISSLPLGRIRLGLITHGSNSMPS